jgi:ketosteroid isomerase-like protein
MNTHSLVERYWQLANARDWTGFAALLAPGVVYEVPQTRERVRGAEHYVEFNRTWPGDWRAEVVKLIAQGDQAVSVIHFHVNGTVETGITFFECQDGLISRLTDHWPEAYEPPARMTTVIERY